MGISGVVNPRPTKKQGRHKTCPYKCIQMTVANYTEAFLFSWQNLQQNPQKYCRLF